MARRRQTKRDEFGAMKKSVRHTVRHDLIAEVERLRAEPVNAERLAALLHELRVYQEEIGVQTAQLVDAQQALEESRDRYVELYDFAPIGYMTLGVNGIIIEINLTGASLLGKERANVLGLPFAGYVNQRDQSRVSDFILRCRGQNALSTVELVLRTPAGDRIVQLVGKYSTAALDAAPRLLTAIIDLTDWRRLDDERKTAEAARARLEKEQAIARASSEAKDQFLAALSHELRTPLTPVVAALSDAALWISLSAEQHAALDLIRRNLDLEVRLIDDLLDVTRIARNRLILRHEPVDVHEALRDVATMSAHGALLRQVIIKSKLDAGRTWVNGDPTRLRQVFWNLLSNAIKFSAPGEVVTISSRNAGLGQVIISVEDTGAGMDAQTLNELFAPPKDKEARSMFRPSSGLGLGLVICQGVVHAHGGTIVARSDGPGRGSTFEVRLQTVDRVQPTAPATPRPEQSAAVRAPSLRILLVEDHPDTAEILSALLRHHGFIVEVAGSIGAAMTLAKSGCDVLVSDVRLPDGSGMDLMRRLRESQPVRGIAMSGFGSPEDIRRSKEAGYDEHLIKPVDVTHLIEAINRVAERTR
jgi:signal transduction histidine kinase/CheY-like chemotaxis protein